MGDKTEGFSSEGDVLGHLATCTESAGRGERVLCHWVLNLHHVNQNLIARPRITWPCS